MRSLKEVVDGLGLDDVEIRRETNTEFLARIMEVGCPTGALIQPFVLQALDAFCHMVAEADVTEMDKPYLSGAAWKRTGAWLQAELDKHYKD